ncbi:hypothetical protein APY04_1241 [Hyphomicrobium sulfonivorans]|uniref:Uncharacterized protein n=1 Tax=Hyphomicrobium sulfonivorans TaxID=121290 RepID=A0A120CWX3_HYPSL|nr:hypothetical protein APY04_1241 [Hyphomicrobium sulfonivorans]
MGANQALILRSPVVFLDVARIADRNAALVSSVLSGSRFWSA